MTFCSKEYIGAVCIQVSFLNFAEFVYEVLHHIYVTT